MLLAAQEVKSVTANVCVEEEENPGVTALSGHVFSSAAAEAPHPSEDIEAVVSQEADSRSAQRSKEVEHYLRLKRYKAAETSHCHFQCHSIPKPVSFLSQGWLQDRSGRWIKDENVEFDSDEEEPPQLALASTNL